MLYTIKYIILNGPQSYPHLKLILSIDCWMLTVAVLGVLSYEQLDWDDQKIHSAQR